VLHSCISCGSPNIRCSGEGNAFPSTHKGSDKGILRNARHLGAGLPWLEEHAH